jgi:hypothetical protein
MLLVDTAVRYSLAAALAYQAPEALTAARGDYARRLTPDLTFSEQIEVDELAASCTVFDVEGKPDAAVVAFRGSTDVKNYLSMFNLQLVPSQLGGSGRVHQGYQHASLRLYECLAPKLERRAASQTVFVGHSYGGGTAQMCAMLHSGREGDLSEVVTFAGPRVGDSGWAHSYDSALGASTTHLAHDLDPVLAQNQVGRSLPRCLAPSRPRGPCGLPLAILDPPSVRSHCGTSWASYRQARR